MNVTPNQAVLHRDECRADEHVAQADTEKQTILVDAVFSEGGYVKRISDERIGKK